MVDIVSLHLSAFIYGTRAWHMLQCLYPPQQTIVHNFFDSLMDDQNLIIQAQVVKAVFVLQILDNIQALLHQHC